MRICVWALTEEEAGVAAQHSQRELASDAEPSFDRGGAEAAHEERRQAARHELGHAQRCAAAEAHAVVDVRHLPRPMR